MSRPHPALEIHEILDAILSEVEPATLVASCSRVNQAWRAVYLSRKIQHRVFLGPAPTSSPRKASPNYKPYCVLNPILDKAFPGWFTPRPDHPMLFNDFTDFTPLKWNKAPETWKREQASWRRMQITQPATTTVQFYEIIEENKDIQRYPSMVGVFRCPQGLLMGDLYDYALSLAARRLRFRLLFNSRGHPPSRSTILLLESHDFDRDSSIAYRPEFFDKYQSLGHASNLAPNMYALYVKGDEDEDFDEWELEAYEDSEAELEENHAFEEPT
ncbi:hypothetical protein K491DRAFT_773538 [Lophiostoma macrostomum CBS 122681]|uniref:F-box domain-containing protein n=1 Tax=Lophiostoma macrostomum CBS 122681 TaxID=1314788 RepID=A0A6A6TRA1_9PLEO|nr:hypothetical protein K491DRAFT_773538 [Lophiostoma macrostomum CBS 122681]